jgi:hypothetical protein
MFPREHFRQPFERSLLECRSSVEGRQAECSHSSGGVRDPSAKMCIEAKLVYVPYYVTTGTSVEDSEVTN